MVSKRIAHKTSSSALSRRLPELDGLRVAVFGLLILYHTGMLYVAGWGWHYKSQYQSEALASLMLWSNQWRMSLLFLISGAAFALFVSNHSDLGSLGKRVGQLTVPLVFGMLVLVVPQVYIEAKSQHIITGLNYWSSGTPILTNEATYLRLIKLLVKRTLPGTTYGTCPTLSFIR